MMEARLARKSVAHASSRAPAAFSKDAPRPRRGAAASKLLETRPRRRHAPLLPPGAVLVRCGADVRDCTTRRDARRTPATRRPRARVLVVVVGSSSSPTRCKYLRGAAVHFHLNGEGQRCVVAAVVQHRGVPAPPVVGPRPRRDVRVVAGHARRRAALSLYTHRRRGRGLRPGPSMVNRAPRRAECVVKGPRPRRRTSSPYPKHARRPGPRSAGGPSTRPRRLVTARPRRSLEGHGRLSPSSI